MAWLKTFTLVTPESLPIRQDKKTNNCFCNTVLLDTFVFYLVSQDKSTRSWMCISHMHNPLYNC